MELLTVALPPGPRCEICCEMYDMASPICIHCGAVAPFTSWYDWYIHCHQVLVEFQVKQNVTVYESIVSEGPYQQLRERKPVIPKLKTSNLYGNLKPIASNKGS